MEVFTKVSASASSSPTHIATSVSPFSKLTSPPSTSFLATSTKLLDNSKHSVESITVAASSPSSASNVPE